MMKKNLIRARKIAFLLGADNFYAITIYDDCVKLQGRYNQQIAAKVMRWSMVIDKNGIITFGKKWCEISLTN